MHKINYKHIFIFSYLINNFSHILSNQRPIIIQGLNQDELLLHSPLRFTTTGINNFLAHTYNHPKYGQEIVPHNTGHFMQLLEHGQSSNQDYAYMLAVLRLLKQKISSCPYMNSTELERLVSHAPVFLLKYFDKKHSSYQKKGCRKLKNLYLQVIDNCIGKTLWDCSEPALITSQFINIGNGLEKLMQLNIISDEDDLNDLLHNLINRLIYVLKLAGSDLPIDFYFNLSKQLAATSWMKIPEVESAVTSKSQKIEQTFLLSRVKSQASADFGIL